ncbi:MAG: DHHW family protein [Eubacterium sp.]
MKKKKISSIICVFCVILIFLSVSGFCKPQSDFSVNENRALQTRPEISFEAIADGSFQKDYESYLCDQFVFRDFWVKAKTAVLRTIGKRDINGVYFGKNGYLLEKSSPDDFDEDLSYDNISFLTEFLNARTDKYNSVSCILVPSKTEVLSNQLPKNAPACCFDETYDEIKDLLEDDVNYIELKKPLKEHKDEYIYYKTDHHWTTLGAYYGYCEYKNALGERPQPIESFTQTRVSDSFIGSSADKVQTYESADIITRFDSKKPAKVTVDYYGDFEKTNTVYHKDLLDEKDKYAYFLGGNYARLTINTDVKNGKNLLIIKDSFANSFVPFLLNDYESITMIDLRYSNQSIDEIEKEHPQATDLLVLYNTEKFLADENQWMLENAE